jgi:hypothetical protein
MSNRGKPQSAEETDEEEESPLTTADLLYRSSDYNTPKSLYMDMVEACGRVGREEDVNGRAMAARQWVIEEVGLPYQRQYLHTPVTFIKHHTDAL